MTDVLGGVGCAGESEASAGSRAVEAFFTTAGSRIQNLPTGLDPDCPRVSFGRMKARELFASVQSRFGVELAEGFEDNPRVAGGVLLGNQVFGNGRDDALVLLDFRAGAVDLPLHVHEHSARFIAVAEGSGFFHYVSQRSAKVRARTVQEGDAIIFLQGVIHTFAAPKTNLRLLSYHAPFFELEDPRQWLVPPEAKQLQKTVDAFHHER